MKRTSRTLTALLLSLMMVLSLLPTAVFGAQEEMSSEFQSLLNEDGALVLPSVPPTEENGLQDFVYDDWNMSHSADGILLMMLTAPGDEDYDPYEAELFIHFGEDNEESHVVPIVYSYDATILPQIEPYVKSFNNLMEFFPLTDLEYFNYLATIVERDSNDDTNYMANFSGKLKELFGYGNLSLDVDLRAGSDSPFSTARIGTARLKYDGVTYYLHPWLGAEAEHAIYVPADTASTPEALMAAAEKRINDYLGYDALSLELGEQTVEEYKIAQLAYYDERIAEAQATVDAAVAEIKKVAETELAALEAEKANLEAQITEINKGISSINAEIAEIEKDIEAAQADVEAAQAAYDAGEDNYIALGKTRQEKLEAHLSAQEALSIARNTYEEAKAKSDNFPDDADLAAATAAAKTAYDDATAVESASYDAYLAADEPWALYQNVTRQELQADIDNAGFAKIDLENTLQTKNNDLNSKQSELYNIEPQLQSKNNEISNKEAEIADMAVVMPPQIQNSPAYWDLQSAINGKDYFLYSFEEEGDCAFMNDAAGGYIFDATIGQQTLRCIIIKSTELPAAPTYKSVDITTAVSISTADSSVPLDTKVQAEKLTGGDEYEKIMNKVTGLLDENSGETYDLKLFSDNKNTYITKLESGKFAVSIPLPEALQGKKLAAYYVDEDGNITEYAVTLDKDGKTATFETDHFSVYTLGVPAPVQVSVGANVPTTTVTAGKEYVDTLLTDEEKTAVDAGTVDASIKLDVKNAQDTAKPEEKKAIEEAAAKVNAASEVALFLDIDLTKTVGTTVTPITELEKAIRITITLPADLVKDGRTFTVYRLHDGQVTALKDLDDDPATVTFETDRFSTYALAYSDVKGAPLTGDSASPLLWAGLLVLAVLGSALLLSKKRSF